ncbi:MAG: hypothetical protein ACLFTR_01680 [Candidatus Woesearchaeota archaeon]
MINLPFDEIIKTIVEKSSLSEEDVKKKIDEKLEHLSGLISKEGAAHIIANELGINFSEMEKKLQVSQIQPGMRNVSLIVRVVQKYEKREFNTGERQGKVANALVGDETGVTRLVMWNDQTDLFDKFSENDILRITNSNARSGQNGRMELHLNDQSKLEINPEGENVERPPQPKTERKKISDLTEQDSSVEILGTIVQVFDPRFFEVDPNTGKRSRPASDGKFYDLQGNEITPDYSYVFNMIVDDGSASIRIVCFRNQMQAVIGKTHEQILGYKDNPSSFNDMKNHLLGQMIKLEGRVVKNDMFDRTELIASRVYMNPDPDKEMEGQDSSASENTDDGTKSAVAGSSTSQESRSQDAAASGSTVSDDDDDSLKPSEMEYDVPKEDVKFSDAETLSQDDATRGTSENSEEKKEQSSETDELESLDELDELDEDDSV